MLQFASHYELFVSVVRSSRQSRSDEVARQRDEWTSFFQAENNRLPSPEELAAYVRSTEVRNSGETVEHAYRAALEEVAANSDELLARERRNVSSVQDGLDNGFGDVGFEETVDLVYHWLKHRKAGQTLSDYVREIREILSKAVAAKTFSVSDGQLVIDTDEFRLVISVRSGKAYVTTFFWK